MILDDFRRMQIRVMAEASRCADRLPNGNEIHAAAARMASERACIAALLAQGNDSIEDIAEECWSEAVRNAHEATVALIRNNHELRMRPNDVPGDFAHPGPCRDAAEAAALAAEAVLAWPNDRNAASKEALITRQYRLDAQHRDLNGDLIN